MLSRVGKEILIKAVAQWGCFNYLSNYAKSFNPCVQGSGGVELEMRGRFTSCVGTNSQYQNQKVRSGLRI